LHKDHFIIFLLVEDSLQVLRLVLNTKCAFYLLLDIVFAFECLVAELASLLPSLLVLVNFPLHLLHLLSERLPDLHLPHVVGLLLLLPLPLNVLVLVVLLALQQFRGLQLSLTVPVQSLMFFMTDLRGGLVESALDLLTLIV
jgi:hypothetical protein